MASYRLVEVGGGGRGPLTQPRLYGSPLEAVERAERLLVELEDRPHRRPFRVDVVDVWTRETVASVRLNVDRDPDVCVACGAPSDPFAPGGDTGVAGPGEALPSQPDPLPGNVESHAARGCPYPFDQCKCDDGGVE